MKIPWKKCQCYSYVRTSSFYDKGGSCCSCWGLDLCSNDPAHFDANVFATVPSGEGEVSCRVKGSAQPRTEALSRPVSLPEP